ncbi:MAG TPA: hypothetical protein VGJ04_05410 [Pirellulales bacterium]|jgi:hypothetical protein
MHYRIPSLLIALLVLLAPSVARAIQFGWQSLPEGGIEYVVQVEPELLDSFRQQGFSSDIPTSLQRNLRRIRLTVGSAKLPNQGDVMGPKDVAADRMPTAAAPRDTMSASNAPAAIEQRKSASSAPPLLSADGTAPPKESSSSTFDVLNLPPPPEPTPAQPQATASAPTESSRPMPSLPFSLSNLTNHPAPAKSDSGMPSKIDVASQQNPQISTPRLNENDVPQTPPRSFDSDHLAMGAAKPAVLETPIGFGGSSPNSTVVAKPWLPLMGTLLALFASIGANFYLAWIHQSVRMKYQALVRRMQGGAATA